MKRKIVTAALALAFASGICGSVYAAETTLKIGDKVITVNGEEQTIDTAPVIIDSRTFVPVRAVVEALGGTADWDAETKTAILENGKDHIDLTIGSKTAVLNGEEKTIDTAPVIIDDRTMLPLRFIAEGFGYETDWEADTKTITVSKADEAEEVKGEAPDNMGILKGHKNKINAEGCETFTQIVDKLSEGQGYTNVSLGGMDVLVAADSVTDLDGQHNAVEGEIFIYANDKPEYIGCVASGGSANPLAVKAGMIYTVGHHYIGKHTITDGELITVEEAGEVFDKDGNATYWCNSDSGKTAEEVFEELNEEYYETEMLNFDVVSKNSETDSETPLKDNKEEAEKEIKIAAKKLIEEIYGDSITDIKIEVDKIYNTKEEQAFEVLKEMGLAANEVAFEFNYEIKPAKDADMNLLLVPDGEYDEKSGWVKDKARLGVLRPAEDQNGYIITNLGTGW